MRDMNNLNIEELANYKGFTYMVVAFDMGHRCGYVKIPSKHPLFGKGYSDNSSFSPEVLQNLPIGDRGMIALITMDPAFVRIVDLFDVHGSLTFAGNYWDDKDWWLGFDCAHAGDAKDVTIMSKKYQEVEAKYLSWREPGDKVWRQADVAGQCKSLIIQIIHYFPEEVI